MNSQRFSHLPVCPDDPILELMVQAARDTNPDKVDLSAGVYKNDQGYTPILEAVRLAEVLRQKKEQTKSYLGLAGDLEFNALVTDMVLGKDHPAVAAGRTGTLQTTGGSGAIRIAGELLKRIQRGACVWVGNPTWANHIPLLQAADLNLKSYPYYRVGEQGVLFDEMVEALSSAQPGDMVLLQGSCHNPCGEDLTLDQWQVLTDLINERKLLPLVDAAYHGLAEPMDQDARGWRLMAASVPEMLIAWSGSKNFSLYRDRAGALIAIASDAERAHAVMTNLMNISRVVYSVPPAHGAALVKEILSDNELSALWQNELATMRDRIIGVRQVFADALAAESGSDQFEFVRHQKGMFSFMPLSVEQARALRRDFSVYLLDSGRINVAGITQTSAPYVARAVARVL